MENRDAYGLWIQPRVRKIYAALALAVVVGLLGLDYAFGHPSLPRLPVIAQATTPVRFNAYTAAVLSDHPQAYWQLQDLSGNDSSGHHLDLTHIVGAKLDSNGPLPYRPSIAFDHTGYASLTNGPVLGSGTSLEFWAKNSDRSTNHVVATSISSPIDNAPRAAIIAFGNPNTIEGSTSFSGIQVFDLSHTTAILSADDASRLLHWWQGWHYFVLTFDPTGMRLYEDSILIGMGTPALLVSYRPSLFVLANNANHNSPFAGSLSQVAVYSSILTPAQINIHRAASTAGLSINPSNLHVALNHSAYFYPHSFDLSGNDISQTDAYDVLSVGIDPGYSNSNGAICLPLHFSARITCTGFHPGIYYVQVRNTAGQVGPAELWVDSPASTFSVLPSTFDVKANAPVLFASSAFSSNGRDVSLFDPSSGDSPRGITCSPPFQRPVN